MIRRGQDHLLALVQSFFQDYLRNVRGASDHTVRAYRDALRLFFLFLASSGRRPIEQLKLDDVRAEAVLAFLDHVESKRGNSSATRNCRLAAIRSLVQHLLRHDVTRADQYGRILAISNKRKPLRAARYLEPEAARAIITAIDLQAPQGTRDRALLLFLYNTGARVSEALAVRPRELRLDRPQHVRLHGKECHSYCIFLRPRHETTGTHACRQAYDLAFSWADILPVVRTGIGLGPYTDAHGASRVEPMSEPYPA
jgi:integrase/recombinase XerD